ncbi:hypothetical protein KC337_g92 [Hortaea werneckii]|nr:hypothetical protein KC337_g92 [Hortaea werneckii]
MSPTGPLVTGLMASKMHRIPPKDSRRFLGIYGKHENRLNSLLSCTTPTTLHMTHDRLNARKKRPKTPRTACVLNSIRSPLGSFFFGRSVLALLLPLRELTRLPVSLLSLR